MATKAVPAAAAELPPARRQVSCALTPAAHCERHPHRIHWGLLCPESTARSAACIAARGTKCTFLAPDFHLEEIAMPRD